VPRRLDRSLQRSGGNKGSAVEPLERFTQNQRIIEEFVAQWLARLPGTMARLAHVAMLRDAYTGRYGHVILERSYSAGAVHESLLYCHEELFAKALESNIAEQEHDLRNCLPADECAAAETARRWLEVELFRCFVPYGTPLYLRDLFISNMRVVLGAVAKERTVAQTVV
jgi:hypothetical protein